LKPIADLFGFLGPALGPVIAGIYAMNKAVAAGKIVWAALNVILDANPFLKIAAVIITLALLIIQNWDSISAFLSGVWTWISNLANTVWTAIGDFFVFIGTKIADFFVFIWTKISDFFVGIWNFIKNTAVGVWNSILNFFVSIGTTIGNAIKNAFNAVVDFFQKLPGRIAGFFGEMVDKALQFGKDIISGIVRGLGNAAKWIWDKLKSIVSNAWDSVLDFFGISSPAKEGIWAGEMIGRGLAQGIAGSVGVVAKAAATLSEAVQFASPAFDPTSPSGMTFQAGTAASTPVGLALPATASATGRNGTTAGATTIYVDNVTQNVAGNLDPTKPVEWRKAMVNMKDGLRKVENDYA
jgi:phage-related protein